MGTRKIGRKFGEGMAWNKHEDTNGGWTNSIINLTENQTSNSWGIPSHSASSWAQKNQKASDSLSANRTETLGHRQENSNHTNQPMNLNANFDQSQHREPQSLRQTQTGTNDSNIGCSILEPDNRLPRDPRDRVKITGSNRIQLGSRNQSNGGSRTINGGVCSSSNQQQMDWENGTHMRNGFINDRAGTSEHNREANDIRPDSTNYTNYRSPHWDVESQTSAATSDYRYRPYFTGDSAHDSELEPFRSYQGNRAASTNFLNHGPGRRGMRRMRHEKFMPMLKSQIELFDESFHIAAGANFEEAHADSMETEIVVTGGDNERPLIQSFAQCGFSDAILKTLDLRKYSQPTLIQKAVIPLIMRKKRYNIMGHAQTGSGKTAAFMLPIINEIQQAKIAAGLEGHTSTQNSDTSVHPFAIIIAPTRELTQQLFDDARIFATNTSVNVVHSYGDMPMKQSTYALRSGCDIFIATCGRVQHFVEATYVKLDKVQFLILDEADRLIGTDFKQTVDYLEQNPLMNKQHRTLIFSATFGEDVQVLSRNLLGDHHFFVRVGQMNSVVNTVTQEFYQVNRFHKQDFLIEVLKKNVTAEKSLANGDMYYEVPKTIVFVSQKRQSDRIAIALCQENFRAQSINADRTLKQRCETVEKFTTGIYNILVATDVAARGLNFPLVQYVINFDLPDQRDRPKETNTYIHRIGRTGRAGNTGTSISLFDPTSESDRQNAVYYRTVLDDAITPIPEFLSTIIAEEEARIRDGFWH